MTDETQKLFFMPLQFLLDGQYKFQTADWVQNSEYLCVIKSVMGEITFPRIRNFQM